MTLRQALQAKVEAAQAEVAKLQSELSQAESTFGAWLDEEVDAFKAKWAEFEGWLSRHI